MFAVSMMYGISDDSMQVGTLLGFLDTLAALA